MALADPTTPAAPTSKTAAFAIYFVAFVTGAIVMSFEMLGSRYLNPYFGSGIYTWAALISTVLLALTVGYFIGGWLAGRMPSARVLGITVLVGSVYVIVLPSFAQPLLEFVLDRVDDDARQHAREWGEEVGVRRRAHEPDRGEARDHGPREQDERLIPVGVRMRQHEDE